MIACPRTIRLVVLLQLLSAGSALAQAAGASASANEERPAQQGAGDTRPPAATASPESPWSIFTTLSNGYASNIHFDQENLGSYGVVLGSGVRYDGDDVFFSYEIAGHRYANTARWNRVSQSINASMERDLSERWEFHTEGHIGLKGTSEDRDLVDQDFEISPRFEFQMTPERRLRLFTIHRLKQYDDAPQTNAFKNYVGAEFREFLQPRRFWEVGARYETNDERANRGDYRRWTYWIEHAIPVTRRDTVIAQVRYRFRRYTARFIEIDDEDRLRVDHYWVPAIGWLRSLGGGVDLRLDYSYEANYSNDPRREYHAHLLWSGFGKRW